MITLTRVKEATAEAIKVLRYGKSDVQTGDQFLPHGIDSKPVKEKLAIFLNTANKNETAILGYLSNTETTEEGETRIYATDDEGIEVFSIYLKNDGTVEFGGTADNLVRYSKLEDAYNELNDKFNKLVSAFNSHVHATAATGPPSTPTPVPSVIPAETSAGDITPAKIEEVKTS